ncbi:MAG: AraC family transcriptional regulator [Burkholderiaceae bacterium]
MALQLPDASHRSLSRCARARVVLVQSGALQIVIGNRYWLLGRDGGLFVPAEADARLEARGRCRLIVLFVNPTRMAQRSSRPERVSPSTLMSTLAQSLSEVPIARASEPRSRRIARLWLDELRLLPLQGIHLPWPQTLRLRALCDKLSRDPSQAPSLSQAAASSGVSPRTLSRRFVRETGMTLAAWIRHARVLVALTEVAKGTSLYDAAIVAGFADASTLCNAFKRVTGVPMRRWFKPTDSQWMFDEATFQRT